MTDYTIVSAPRISQAGFTAVLHAAGSPAAAEAPSCYQAAIAHGVDPAVLLAVFHHESGYGRAGVATGNHSWGNIRVAGVFVHYADWTAGAADAARLLMIYGRNAIRPGTNTSTTRTFPFVWAPAADHNAPAAYGDALVADVTAWHAKYPTGSNPIPPAARPATYRVRAGDTLSAIAAAKLGRSSRWREIYTLNRRAIGSNPNLIHPGQVLTLPRR